MQNPTLPEDGPADLQLPDGNALPPEFDPGYDLGLFSPFYFLSHPLLLLQHPLALIGSGLWLWMLVHCIRNDPDRNIWLWVLIILNVPGALLYFVLRWLPDRRVSHPAFVTRWTRARLVAQRETAARQIGNAHQWVELGDVLREVGSVDKAAHAYQQALKKDPGSLPALWGAALAEMQRKNFAAARDLLQSVLAKDDAYKFGDVSLAYGRMLVSLNECEPACVHLERHLKRWTHPEAYVLLATLLIEKGEPEPARACLENTLSDIRGGPPFFARQNRTWARKARKLLRRLPKGELPPLSSS